MSTSVCVIGSINMDLVVRAERFARPGETLLGGDFHMELGGKGASQAVAASRMGAQVTLVGCLGEDDWGSSLRGVLATEGVDIQRVRSVEKTHTGIGILTVVPDGESSCVVAPGANARFSIQDVDEASGAIAEAEVLLLQAEIPIETNRRAIELAQKSNTVVVFNAAPSVGLPTDLLRDVDILVLNQGEASNLLGDTDQEVAPTGLARRLASYGPERVVLTLGSRGAIHFNGEEMKTFDAFAVDCIDATAAGDAFVGALVTLRAEGARLKDAVRHACAAGALATTIEGAIPALPSRDKVEGFVKKEVGAAS